MDTWRLDSQTIFETGPLQEYLAALRFAGRCEGAEQRILLAVGDPGVGKTIGARVFCQESRGDPIYINLPSPQLLRPRDLLSILADRLGCGSDFRSRYDFARHLCDDSLRSPRLLLLDNAQSLRKYDWLEMLSWIHDEGGHIFILIGTHSLEQVFVEHREFAGRVALRHQVRIPTAEEIAPLFPEFPSEAIEQIREETGGRMRQVISLRRRLLELIEDRKLDVSDLAPKQVRMVARHFLVKAA